MEPGDAQEGSAGGGLGGEGGVGGCGAGGSDRSRAGGVRILSTGGGAPDLHAQPRSVWAEGGWAGRCVAVNEICLHTFGRRRDAWILQTAPFSARARSSQCAHLQASRGGFWKKMSVRFFSGSARAFGAFSALIDIVSWCLFRARDRDAGRAASVVASVVAMLVAGSHRLPAKRRRPSCHFARVIPLGVCTQITPSRDTSCTKRTGNAISEQRERKKEKKECSRRVGLVQSCPLPPKGGRPTLMCSVSIVRWPEKPT